MNNKITGDYIIATIRFLDDTSGRTYRYACFDKEIRYGDTVVVKSAQHGFGLARVEDFCDKTDEELTREIVAKFDMTAYNKRVDAREAAAKLKEKMKQRAAALQDVMLFETLAATDAEMAELLKYYKMALGDM